MKRERKSIDEATPAEWDALRVKTTVIDRTEVNEIDHIENKINHPSHYNNGKIECIDYIVDNLGRNGASYYCEGNVKKYIHRWRYKDASPIDDLRKARWYLDKLIELQL